MRTRRRNRSRRAAWWQAGLGLAALALALAAGLAWTQLRRAADILGAFAAELAAGRPAAAAAYLVPELAGDGGAPAGPAIVRTLASLALLATQAPGAGVPVLETTPRLDPATWLGRRQLALDLALPGPGPQGGPAPRLRLWFSLRRSARAGWQVSGLPPVLAHPAALVRRGGGEGEGQGEGQGQGGAVGLQALIRGQTVRLREAGPAGALPRGYEVGFAVTVGDSLLSLHPVTPAPLSKLLRVGPAGIETRREGLVPLAADRALYDLTAGPPALLARLPVGAAGLAAYRWQGETFGVALTEPPDPGTIRVVLGTSGFAGLEHSRLTVSSAAPVVIRDQVAGRRVQVAGGAAIILRRDGAEVVAENARGHILIRSPVRLHLEPGPGERLTIASLTRGPAGGEFRPAYRGHLEVAPAWLGLGFQGGPGLHVVNELPLDQYLYSVVPSEMPVAFGLEALRVQALAARAYAAASMRQGGHAGYGAHVEDSVMSQVYNNVPEQALSSQAVDLTAFEVPAYQGQVVDARFFSTSSGFTANAHEVWSAPDGSFPGTPVPYLRAVPQTTAVAALPDEAAVAAFLARADLDAPDAAAPFFRWSVTMTRGELEATIRANLAARQVAQPGFVLTRDAAGRFASRPVPGPDPIGRLLDIRVIRRGQGGNLMEIELTGSAGTYRIQKELNIRMVLRPVQHLAGRPPVGLRLQDGSIRNNLPLLPSAFVVFEAERGPDGTLTGVTIRGGGHGHGAGMSQTGVLGLAQRGLDYRAILRHYYPGSEVVDLRDLR